MPLTHSDYHVGILCTQSCETTAVRAMLDEEHDLQEVSDNDNNVYSLGRIGRYNVVVASSRAGDYGAAAEIADSMKGSFPRLRYYLMVGIAGGVPRPLEEGGDIRLGDVVVGCTTGVPSVINYEYGQQAADGFQLRSELDEPPEGLCRAVGLLAANHMRQGPTYLLHLAAMFRNNPRLNSSEHRYDYYNRPDVPDQLLGAGGSEVERSPRTLRAPPDGIGEQRFVHGSEDDGYEYPNVFHGTIGSASKVPKNAAFRDETYDMVKQQCQAKVLCFEMEGAGVVNKIPCLVIRGISNYCDAIKTDEWQNFAAATAAAYAKDLLLRLPPATVEAALPAAQIVGADTAILKATAKEHEEHTHGNIADIKRWLNAPDPWTNHALARERCAPNTGQWLLRSEEYVKWKSDHAPQHLWLHGRPGCGKTVLCSTIIEDLRSEKLRCPLAVFYFCSHDDCKQRYDDLLRSLVLQTAVEEQVQSRLRQAYEQSDTRVAKRDDLEKIVLASGKRDGLILAIDALDESVEMSDVLIGLARLVKQLPRLRIIATSRMTEDILRLIRDLAFEPITVDNPAVGDDIGLYVESRLKNDKALDRLDEDTKSLIRQHVAEKSDGMSALLVLCAAYR